MNHLEQLVTEWLQYQDYFVRSSIPVGPLAHGGHEGELDVVAVNFKTRHLLHVECSLDALPKAARQTRFTIKFERGRRFARQVFGDIDLPETLDQVVVLQASSAGDRSFGGGRLVTVRELIREIVTGLRGTSPLSRAVSSNLPLVRMVQFTADAFPHMQAEPIAHRLVPGGSTA